jgi:glucosylceramidase
MKIDRRTFLAASSSALLFAKRLIYAQPSDITPQPTRRTAARDVTVYTTADQTEYRLSRTATVKFEPMGQPLETQICVFVDPTRTFQTILGVGGALTDASAETFAKLPRPKQQELLDAYFNRDNGLAYTLARTNIHSCDFSSGSYTLRKATRS